MSDSIETAVNLSGGLVAVDVIGGEELKFSQTYACEEHGISIPELTPTMFSFNNPMGACPHCMGIGMFMKVNPKLLISDDSLSLLDGAIKASGWGVNSWFNPDASTIAEMYYRAIAERFNFDIVDKLMKIFRNRIKFSPSKEPYITFKLLAEKNVLAECKEFLGKL